MKRYILLILSSCIITVFGSYDVKATNIEEVFQLRRKTSECATENEKSVSCGANKGKPSCCTGLVCHEYQYWKCVKAENVKCAAPGTISKECGSKWNKATPKCCADLKCVDNYCMPISTPTDKPTLPPTSKPTPKPTIFPTPIPTMSPTKKTRYRVKAKVKCLYNVCDRDGWKNDSDPYVKVIVNGKKYKTTTKGGVSKNTCWNKTFDFGYHNVDKYGKMHVLFEVYDEDDNTDDYMGEVAVSTKKTTSGQANLSPHYYKMDQGDHVKECTKTQLSYTVYLS